MHYINPLGDTKSIIYAVSYVESEWEWVFSSTIAMDSSFEWLNLSLLLLTTVKTEIVGDLRTGCEVLGWVLVKELKS